MRKKGDGLKLYFFVVLNVDVEYVVVLETYLPDFDENCECFKWNQEIIIFYLNA